MLRSRVGIYLGSLKSNYDLLEALYGVLWGLCVKMKSWVGGISSFIGASLFE